MTENLVYIANAGDAGYGITVAALDYDSGSLEVVQRVTEISECHYLNLHPGGELLLATTMDGAVEVVVIRHRRRGQAAQSEQQAGRRHIAGLRLRGRKRASVCCWSTMSTAGRAAIFAFIRFDWRWARWARSASILRLTTAPARMSSARMCRIRT